MLRSGDPVLLRGVQRSLRTLASHQADNGQIPKFVQARPASVRSYVNVTVYPDVGHGFDLPKSEERMLQDPLAHKGSGGTVRYYGDAATADKARAFAVEFFKSNLAAK